MVIIIASFSSLIVTVKCLNGRLSTLHCETKTSWGFFLTNSFTRNDLTPVNHREKEKKTFLPGLALWFFFRENARNCSWQQRIYILSGFYDIYTSSWFFLLRRTPTKAPQADEKRLLNRWGSCPTSRANASEVKACINIFLPRNWKGMPLTVMRLIVIVFAVFSRIFFFFLKIKGYNICFEQNCLQNKQMFLFSLILFFSY